MTLPNYVRLHHLDRGIRELVLNLNRIPGLYTQTTCEGHVWREVPAWPTKDGWVHFQKPKGQHNELVNILENYCTNTSQIFTLDNRTWQGQNQVDEYTLCGKFESHQGENGLKPFDSMNKQEQKAYWNRADARKIELLEGWKELNNLVFNYIKKELKVDPKELKYRNKADKTDFRVFSHCH